MRTIEFELGGIWYTAELDTDNLARLKNETTVFADIGELIESLKKKAKAGTRKIP